MENWQLALLTAALAFVGAVFGVAVKSPKKFIVLANAATPVFSPLFAMSFGITIGSLLPTPRWGWAAFGLTSFLFGLRLAAGITAEHLIRADLAEKRVGRDEVREQGPDE